MKKLMEFKETMHALGLSESLVNPAEQADFAEKFSKIMNGEEVISEKTDLPKDHGSLNKQEVVKMLYLASGWIEGVMKNRALGSQLEKIALEVHDADV